MLAVYYSNLQAESKNVNDAANGSGPAGAAAASYDVASASAPDRTRGKIGEDGEVVWERRLRAYYCTGGTVVPSEVGKFHVMDRSTHPLLSPSSVTNRLSLIEASRRQKAAEKRALARVLDTPSSPTSSGASVVSAGGSVYSSPAAGSTARNRAREIIGQVDPLSKY